MIHTVEDAISVFFTTGLDALVMKISNRKAMYLNAATHGIW